MFKFVKDFRAQTYSGEGYNEGYDTHLRFQHSFSKRLGLELGANYDVDSYSNNRKDDHTYKGSLKLGYAFHSWLKAGLEYTYTRKNSKVAMGSYTNNTTLLSGSIAF
jgi:uncharacterized protein (PEP-CTERM system associated)